MSAPNVTPETLHTLADDLVGAGSIVGRAEVARTLRQAADQMSNDFPGDLPLDGGPPMPDRVDELLREIVAELIRARNKFPGNNVTFMALSEEVGELAKAMFSEPCANVRKEAVQVAVMAMRIILDGDHTLEAWRYMKGLDELVVRDAQREEPAP